MRNETLFSIDELNDRIESLLQLLNDKPRPEHGGKSRRELFEELDKPALRALPRGRFVYAEWKKAKVNIDYHIDIEKRFYSAPFSLVREFVDVRITAATVEIFFNGNRVASHQRSHKIGVYRTTDEHMPKAHQEHANWTPSALIRWGERIGPSTGELISKILNRWKHPEQGYRSCLGLRSLAKRYGEDRLEAAARRALRHRAIAYRHIKNILKNGLDQLEEQEENVQQPVVHENIRGPGYYNGEE
jgi:transposase